MENVIKQIQNSINFDIADIILLALLFICLAIQFYYYFSFYQKPLAEAKKRISGDGNVTDRNDFPKVSVVIVSENESENLAQNLPFVLEQDYPNFEVIVVNDGSTDESDILLQSLKLKYPHLYSTYLPVSPDKNFTRRKLTLTLGIKASTGDVLLFTDPYCKPVSEKWIYSMMEELNKGKDVVLGYSYFKIDRQKLFNRGARFRNLLYSLQYLSMALKNKPYTGVFRNVAFRKDLFFEHKGFSSLLNIDNGEDLFINRIVTEGNTCVALSQASFIEADLYSYSLWKQLKRSCLILNKYFEGFTAKIFSCEYISRFMFYLLFFVSIINSCLFNNIGLLALSAFLFILRFLMQLVVIGKTANYFKSGRFVLSLPLLDISQLFDRINFKRLFKRK